MSDESKALANVSQSKALAMVSQIKLALTHARTVEDFAQVRVGAEALRTLAQKAHLALEIRTRPRSASFAQSVSSARCWPP
jgi:hypothetical protein